VDLFYETVSYVDTHSHGDSYNISDDIGKNLTYSEYQPMKFMYKKGN